MLKATLGLVAALVLLVAGSSAQASQAPGGYISKIIVMGDVIFFTLDGERTATPACHTISGRWAFNVTTPAGQAKFAFLLSAYNTHKKIGIAGADNCAVWNDTESVSWFWIVE